jgi:amino acid adenylation domain-containing protein
MELYGEAALDMKSLRRDGGGPVHLARLVETGAELHGDRPCLVSEGALVTCRGLAARVGRLAAWLRRSGIGWGDRIVIVASNSIDAVSVALAAARAGAIFSLLHPAIRERGLAAILKQVEPSMVFFDGTTSHLASQAAGAVPVFLGAGAPPPGGIGLEAALAEMPEGPAGEPVGGGSDPACLVYTSGSTGEPRGVVLTHESILFAVEAIQERLGYLPSDVVGLFLPLSFDYGLYQVFLALNAGASLFVGRPESAGPELLSLLASQRISVLPGVPSFFSGLLKLLARSPGTRLELRAVTNTGAHLSRAQIDELRQRIPGCAVFPMYGLTECKRVSILLPEEIDARPGSVGRPLAGTRAVIADADGMPLPPGEAGELVILGPHVKAGYWRAPAETAARFRPWAGEPGRALHTGDRFRMDEEGYLYFLGRMDALFKRRGFRIHPAEIEEAAGTIPGVLETALCHGEDGKLDLFVTLSNPSLAAGDILRELNRRVEPFKVPDRVHVLDEMPKTGNGKIDRAALSRPAAAGGPDRPAAKPEDLARRWRELVAEFGSPLWLYDLDTVGRRAAEIFGLLPPGSDLYYSLKANPLPAIAGEALRAGCGAEVSSVGELAVALAAGCPGERILYTGPAKTRDEVARALEAGVSTFSVESWGDLERLERTAGESGRQVRVLLRVNPREAPRAGLAMTGVDSQFGFEEDDLLEGGDRLAGLSPRVEVLGLHIYFGSQIGGAEALAAAFGSAIEVSERLSERFGRSFQVLDLGGGFPWPYATHDPAPDLGGLAEPLARLAAGRRRTAGAGLWFESGRYLCASSGTLLATVMDVKRSRKGKTRIVLDTGIHHLGGMSGLGRIPRQRVSFDVVPGRPGGAPVEVDVVGPLCSPLDCLARGIGMAEARAGDLVAIPNTGAYGLTASLYGFLSRPAPVELACRGTEVVGAFHLQGGHARLDVNRGGTGDPVDRHSHHPED